eukprot:1752070-Rhodomonas_salina.1
MSTSSDITCAVQKLDADSSSKSTSVRHTVLWRLPGSMHASVAVSWSLTSKVPTRSCGRPWTLAISETGVTSNSSFVGGGVEQHAAARLSLIEGDEREEEDLLREAEAAAARRLPRRPLVPRVDPVRAAEATVEGVARVDGACKARGKCSGTAVAAEDPGEERSLRAGLVEGGGGGVNQGLGAVLGERRVARRVAAAGGDASRDQSTGGDASSSQDLHRSVLRARAARVAATLHSTAEDAALEGDAVGGGARGVGGAHRQEVLRGREVRDDLVGVRDGEVEGAVEGKLPSVLAICAGEASGVQAVVAR